MSSIKNNYSESTFIPIKIFEDLIILIGLTLQFIYGSTSIGQMGFILVCAAGALCMVRSSPLKIKTCSFLLFYLLLIFYFQWRIHNGDSRAPIRSSEYILTMYRCLVFMVFAYQYTVRRNIKELTVICTIFSVIISVFVLAKGGISSGNRLDGSGLNSNSVGMLLAFSFSLLSYGLLRKNVKRKAMSYILCFMFIIVILASGSRKALFLCALPILLYYTFNEYKKAFYRIAIAVAVILIGYYMIMNVESLYYSVGYRVEGLLTWLDTGQTNDASMNSRADYTELGMRYFYKYPWKGVGLACFATLKGSYGTYSHNNFVEILVSGGIPAFVLFYFPFAKLIFDLIISSRENKDGTLILYIIICNLFMHIAVIVMFSRIDLFMYIVLFSVYNNMFEKTKENYNH